MSISAVVELEGHQYRISAGERLAVPRLDCPAGESLEMDRVLMVIEDGKARIGQPQVPGAKVKALVTRHFKGPKIEIVKYKQKKRYRRHNGYRDLLSEIRVEEIIVPEETVPAEPTRRKAKAAEGGSESGS